MSVSFAIFVVLAVMDVMKADVTLKYDEADQQSNEVTVFPLVRLAIYYYSDDNAYGMCSLCLIGLFIQYIIVVN